ncbi:hypothetical protein QWI28_22030 [Citrobacter freundii]|nr:hypothetical protein [Citrobacter amalonaticus]MDO3407048.1 hypothetical protein [Citrobacter freundii]HCB1899721.1 hypothetical protein [Citrobacter amalonaticus]
MKINHAALQRPEPDPHQVTSASTLYARCDEENSDTCFLLQQIAEMEIRDQKDALSALVKMIQVASSGKPFKNYYDAKQCHDCHTFTHDGKEHTIWRVWKGKAVRITFYYGEDRVVLLTSAFVKREDKLTKKQKLDLEAEVKSYLNDIKNKQLELFEIE